MIHTYANTHTEKKNKANLSYNHRNTSLKQNTINLFQANNNNKVTPKQLYIILDMQEWFGIVKYLDVIYIINVLKKKNKCDPFSTG